MITNLDLELLFSSNSINYSLISIDLFHNSLVHSIDLEDSSMENIINFE